MSDLLNLTINAHGGSDNWNKFSSVNARIACGGRTWKMKQQSGILDDIYISTSTKREFTTHYPFINKNWHTSFEPNRVAIEDENNAVVEELLDPRSSFNGHVRETPWTRLQLIYFAGYAIWTYLNAPFNFANPGYHTEELDTWKENDETFRRLRVTFPKEIATHSTIQTFYIDKEGLIRRHDYDVDIINGASSAHYLSDYIDVQGMKVATKRRVYLRKEDNTSVIPEPLLVSIDLSEVSFR